MEFVDKDIKIISSDKKEPIVVDEDVGKIYINIEKLELDQKNELGRIIKEYFQQEGAILTDRLLDYSTRFDEYEQLTEKKSNPDLDLLNFFKNKITQEDYIALKTSLFMRSLYRNGGNIKTIKKDIALKFGERGNNIANLCTAGYFENFLRPLYNQIHENGEEPTPDATFEKIYELIVKQGLLAVFVSRDMKERDVDNEVRKRIEDSKRYGFNEISNVLYVHALSAQNVRTVIKWMEKCEYLCDTVAQGQGFVTISTPINMSFGK